jgi:hypothetical protein
MMAPRSFAVIWRHATWALGGFDCAPGLRRAAFRHRGDNLAVGRVQNGQRLAAFGIAPLAVDVCLGPE